MKQLVGLLARMLKFGVLMLSQNVYDKKWVKMNAFINILVLIEIKFKRFL